MIKDLCVELGFDDEAISTYADAHKKITGDEECAKTLAKARLSLFEAGNKEFETALIPVADKLSINRYTVEAVFILDSALWLRKIYEEKGYPDWVFINTMRDLVFKTEECRKMYGITGTFVMPWYKGFFMLTRFALGRLQYDILDFSNGDAPKEAEGCDVTLKCHIPSDGALTPELVCDSLKKAYEFMGAKKNLYLKCETWLLYPKTAKLYKKGSNLEYFYNIFTITNEVSWGKNSDAWRIFYVSDDVPLEDYPENSSLQKAFKSYFLSGGTMGYGSGYLIFDGQKIISI